MERMYMTSWQPYVLLVYQTNPVVVQFFSYVNTFFCSKNLDGRWTCECAYTLLFEVSL